MQEFNSSLLKKLYIPPSSSHKGENGKVLLIGGSKLFHAASLWSLSIASKIVDMVFYASVGENNQIVQQAKEEFRNGIVVPRSKIDDYISEADCVLIGPGLPRSSGEEPGDDDTKILTERLLKKYPDKKWVIDGGSLQAIDPEILIGLRNVIMTPHKQEFETLKVKGQKLKVKNQIQNSKIEDQVQSFVKEYGVTVLLKGETDIVVSNDQSVQVSGGNAGMTKGGTGDVLAGLVAALYAQNNDPFLVASCASYINKKAGESLFKRVGYYFNASDLVEEIPKVLKELLL